MVASASLCMRSGGRSVGECGLDEIGQDASLIHQTESWERRPGNGGEGRTVIGADAVGDAELVEEAGEEESGAGVAGPVRP